MEIVYEDNHLIVVNKASGEIVQGDKTGDEPMCETLKKLIKERDSKPGNVFCGVIHRLDRPTSGLVVFAKTSKALSRMNTLFRDRDKISKTYWALTRNTPVQTQGTLTHYLSPMPGQSNKMQVSDKPAAGAKEAVLHYRVIGRTKTFCLLEIKLDTGRKHQIRAQLAAIGCPVRGDLKYGDRRSNPDGSISLQAHALSFEHPVSHQPIDITAPWPESWPQPESYIDE